MRSAAVKFLARPLTDLLEVGDGHGTLLTQRIDASSMETIWSFVSSRILRSRDGFDQYTRRLTGSSPEGRYARRNAVCDRLPLEVPRRLM